MRRATGDIAANVSENPALDGLRDMDERLLILAGGLPIEIGSEGVASLLRFFYCQLDEFKVVGPQIGQPGRGNCHYTDKVMFTNKI